MVPPSKRVGAQMQTRTALWLRGVVVGALLALVVSGVLRYGQLEVERWAWLDTCAMQEVYVTGNRFVLRLFKCVRSAPTRMR